MRVGLGVGYQSRALSLMMSHAKQLTSQLQTSATAQTQSIGYLSPWPATVTVIL